MKGFSIFRAIPLLFLLLSFAAGATAPRISAQMFGVEKKDDIAAYSSSGSGRDVEMLTELVMAAFAEKGLTPVLDVMPSRQLARYALSSGDSPSLVGLQDDIPVKGNYRTVVFYLRGKEGEAELLIFSREGRRADELYRAFNSGLQAILKNGKYRKIVEKHHGRLPENFELKLKGLNPGWK